MTPILMQNSPSMPGRFDAFRDEYEATPTPPQRPKSRAQAAQHARDWAAVLVPDADVETTTEQVAKDHAPAGWKAATSRPKWVVTVVMRLPLSSDGNVADLDFITRGWKRQAMETMKHDAERRMRRTSWVTPRTPPKLIADEHTVTFSLVVG